MAKKGRRSATRRAAKGALQAPPHKPAAPKAKRSAKSQARPKAKAPAEPFSLILPLGADVRVILEGLSDSDLVRYVAPDGTAGADNVGRLQVKRSRQWVDAP